MVVSSYRDVLEITCSMFDNLCKLSGWEDQTLKKRMTYSNRQEREGKTYCGCSDEAYWLIYFSSSTAVKEQFKNLLEQLRSMCTNSIGILMLYV